MATPAHTLRPDLLSDVVCDDITCSRATSHRETCVCACDGEGHGAHGWRPIAQAAAKAAAGRDPFARLPKAAADDGWWNEPTGRPVVRTFVNAGVIDDGAF